MPHQTYRFTAQIVAPTHQEDPAYWFIFQGDKLLVRPLHDKVEIPLAVDLAQFGLVPLRKQYLGYLQDEAGRQVHCYSAEVDTEIIVPDGWVVEGLRQLYPQLDELFFTLAGRAVQIVDWDRTHQYCGRCGMPTEISNGERAKRCPQCRLMYFPRLSPATITAVIRRTETGKRLLLARNHRFPAGRYSVIAGFVEPGESLEECVHREVLEEVGICIKNVRYFGSQPWPFPNSLMIGFTAEYEGGDFELEEAEIADAQWFAADDLPLLPPKMSIARQLIDWFVEDNHSV